MASPDPNVEIVDRECMIYGQTMVWVAEFIRRRAREGVGTEEEIRAQVDKDLMQLLDQEWRPF